MNVCEIWPFFIEPQASPASARFDLLQGNIDQKNGLNSNRKTAHYLLHPERRLHFCTDAIEALVSIS